MTEPVRIALLAGAAVTAAAAGAADLARRRAARRWGRLLPEEPGEAAPRPAPGAGPARPAPARLAPGLARLAGLAGLAGAARRDTRERQAVASGVPLLLDLLVLCVDGGLNLHQALEAVPELVEGPLREALAEVRRELRAGTPLPRVLENLARRWDVEEVHTFVRILRVGQALGTPVADSLRQSARFLRERLRLRTEQRLARVPLQLTLCTVVFFLPPVFVLLLLPNLLNLAAAPW